MFPKEPEPPGIHQFNGMSTALAASVRRAAMVLFMGLVSLGDESVWHGCYASRAVNLLVFLPERGRHHANGFRGNPRPHAVPMADQNNIMLSLRRYWSTTGSLGVTSIFLASSSFGLSAAGPGLPGTGLGTGLLITSRMAT